MEDLQEFMSGIFYKRVGFTEKDSHYSLRTMKKKDLLLLATKLTKKIPDPTKARKHYELFLKNKD